MAEKKISWLKQLERSVDRSLGYDMSTPAARRRAWWHFQLIDHHMLRHWWTNLYEIRPGVWRSNQPDAKRIRKYRDMGIKTVLNLRGTGGRSHHQFEVEACQEYGLTLVNHRLNARGMVPKEELLSLLDTFETIEHPFVMHCKSGADRAGLAAALYLLHIENVPVAEAMKQLSFRYLHIKRSRTGILDHMLDMYAADRGQSDLPIRDWIETKYDKQVVAASFDKKRAAK